MPPSKRRYELRNFIKVTGNEEAGAVLGEAFPTGLSSTFIVRKTRNPLRRSSSFETGENCESSTHLGRRSDSLDDLHGGSRLLRFVLEKSTSKRRDFSNEECASAIASDITQLWTQCSDVKTALGFFKLFPVKNAKEVLSGMQSKVLELLGETQKHRKPSKA